MTNKSATETINEMIGDVLIWGNLIGFLGRLNFVLDGGRNRALPGAHMAFGLFV